MSKEKLDSEAGEAKVGLPERLLPCPFCGSEAIGGTDYVACTDAGCQMSLRPLLRHQWQTRAGSRLGAVHLNELLDSLGHALSSITSPMISRDCAEVWGWFWKLAELTGLEPAVLTCERAEELRAELRRDSRPSAPAPEQPCSQCGCTHATAYELGRADERAASAVAGDADALREALREILNSGVEFDGHEGYVVMQVDRKTIAEARALVSAEDPG